jgi:hypothetical protein
MRIFVLPLFLFLLSCAKNSNPQPLIINIPDYPVAVEINSVPPPFDMNGYYPYVVWMNGKRVNLPRKDLLLLVDKVGKENIPVANDKDIHRGWLFPYFADKDQDFPLLSD